MVKFGLKKSASSTEMSNEAYLGADLTIEDTGILAQ